MFGLSAVMYRNLMGWRPYALMYYLRAIEMPLQLLCFGAGLAVLSGSFAQAGYGTFLFPGLVTLYIWFATIMESTYITFNKAFNQRIWEAVVLTPVKLHTVILADQLLTLFKGLTLALLFFAAGVAIGVVPSIPGMLLGLFPLAAMTLCFTAMGHLMCGWARNDYDFDPLWPLLGTPMLLVSGIFYPTAQLPVWVQKAALASPLYHGVEAFRPLVMGNFDPAGPLWHGAVLLAFWAILTTLAARRFHRRLFA